MTTPSLPELAAAEVRLAAALDRVKKAHETARRALQDALDETGVKGLDVRQDGVDVATITRTVPKPRATVTDEAALAAWVKANRPAALVPVVSPAWIKATLDDAGGGVPFDSDTGEVIPGFGITVSGTPNHRLNMTKEGTAWVAAAHESGELLDVVTNALHPAARADGD